MGIGGLQMEALASLCYSATDDRSMYALVATSIECLFREVRVLACVTDMIWPGVEDGQLRVLTLLPMLQVRLAIASFRLTDSSKGKSRWEVDFSLDGSDSSQLQQPRKSVL